MDIRIAVAAEQLQASYQGIVYGHLRKLVRAGQVLDECVISRWDDPAFLRDRLCRLLEGGAKPTALLGICIRPDYSTLAAYRAAGVPVVLIDERAEGASTVASDGVAGGYLAAQHLARAGRKAIAVVGGPVRDFNSMQRMRGIAKALSESGLPLPAENVIEAPSYSRRDGMAAMARLLELGRGTRRIDGVVCAAGDACAMGLLAAAQERGVKVPEELAVVGYDDAPLAATSDPPLTTINQSPEAIAREALRLATEQTTTILLTPKTVLLEPKLVIRASA